jgi:hypothetical protein
MNGHPHQPANMPLKQTTLVNVRVSVTPTPDGGAILSFELPGEQVVVPLDAAARDGVGKALLAPSIVPASHGTLN